MWEFHHLHPDLGGAGLEWLARARTLSVEIVTHPADDNPKLGEAPWRAATSDLDLASYCGLAERLAAAARPASLPPREPEPRASPRGWRRLLQRSGTGSA